MWNLIPVVIHVIAREEPPLMTLSRPRAWPLGAGAPHGRARLLYATLLAVASSSPAAAAATAAAAAAAATAASTYTLTATRLRSPATSTGAVVCGRAPPAGSARPLDYCATPGVCCSQATRNSNFTFNYNPAWMPLPGGGDGLMVRVADPVPGAPSPFFLYGYSRFAVVERLGGAASLAFENVTADRVVFEDTPDTEDPYVVFDAASATYLLFYTAVATDGRGVKANSTMMLATNSGDPRRAGDWVRRGAVFPQLAGVYGKTCCGGLLLGAGVPGGDGWSYLFSGCTEPECGSPGILVARTRTPADVGSYELLNETLLRVRPGSWDSEQLEGGPAPLQLSDGNWLYLYDTFIGGSRKGGRVGWAVLSLADPTQVVARADAPLLSPEDADAFAWEREGLTPNGLFLNGMQRTPGTGVEDNDFTVYYGGADTAVGASRVKVVISAASSAATSAVEAPPPPPPPQVSSVVIDVGAAPSPRVARLAAVVQRVLGERCGGVAVTVSTDSGFVCGGGGGPGGGGGAAFVLVLRVNATALSPEAFAVASCADAGGGVLVEGGDELGLVFGVGRFLHSSDFGPAPTAFTPSAWRGADAPAGVTAMRAVYLATHFNNFFVSAPPSLTAAYIEDLALWGLNTVVVTIPVQQFAGFADPSFAALAALLRTLFASAAGVGLRVGLIHVVNQGFSTRPQNISYTPFPDPQHVRGDLGFLTCADSGAEYLSALSAEMLGTFDALDTIIFWPYDEGGCGCGADWPWGARGFPRISAAVLAEARTHFPELQAILSTWMFDQPAAGEFDGLDDYLRGAGAGLFGATMADNHADFPQWPIMHHGGPGGLPLLNFPEVSMWGRSPWGGFGANPLPSRFQALWDETAGLVAGGAPYAEGIYIDINIVIALRHYWGNSSSSSSAANSTVLAYAAFEFGGAENAALVARAVALLEEAWEGARPGPGAGIAAALLEQVDAALARANPAVAASWRWRVLLLRARIDLQLFANGGAVDCANAALAAAFAELARIYYSANAFPAVRPPCT